MSDNPTQPAISARAWMHEELLSSGSYSPPFKEWKVHFEPYPETSSPLYDQAALDAAVAAERERCAQLFDVPAGINGEAEDWARAAAARIRSALS